MLHQVGLVTVLIRTVAHIQPGSCRCWYPWAWRKARQKPERCLPTPNTRVKGANLVGWFHFRRDQRKRDLEGKQPCSQLGLGNCTGCPCPPKKKHKKLRQVTPPQTSCSVGPGASFQTWGQDLNQKGRITKHYVKGSEGDSSSADLTGVTPLQAHPNNSLRILEPLQVLIEQSVLSDFGNNLKQKKQTKHVRQKNNTN